MYQNEGYWNVKPKIKAVSFPKRGKFEVTLQDGRSITMPISAFPSMKKVPVKVLTPINYRYNANT